MRLLALVAPIVLAALGVSQTADAEPTASSEVTFATSSLGEVHVAVEVALDDPSRARGLMFRTSLASGKGMLFLFPVAKRNKFWMRNTLIPLDMIFLDSDKNVVYVEESAKPRTDDARGPDGLSQFVVEVPGGWARPHGIKPGVSARFVNVPSHAY